MGINILSNMLLRIMAIFFNYKPSLNKYLKNSDGWINFCVGFQTQTNSVKQSIRFHNGHVSVISKIPDDVNVILKFIDDKTLLEMLRIPPNEVLNLMLKNRLITSGNLAYLQIFNFYVSLLLGKTHQKMLDNTHQADIESRTGKYSINNPELSKELHARKQFHMKCEHSDIGVKYLDDQYLSKYCIDDFPRLKRFIDIHFNEKPEICAERPKLLTKWYKENGFEKDCKGEPWNPVLRQAHAFKYLMENKTPVIAQNDLIAGTTTSKEPTGVIIYPDAHGGTLMGELKTIDKRLLNPYKISDETISILYNEVFPFWINRNFTEWVRMRYQSPICQQINEHWVAYFVWKSVGISHTIPDFPTILNKGTNGIIQQIKEKLESEALEIEKKDTLQAMVIVLEGLNSYARNLSVKARNMAQNTSDPMRRKELGHLSEICSKVPANPCETLDEAVNCAWITWIALHMENTNTGLSLGRLDQWFQPYFENDIKKLTTDEEKNNYIKHAIEIIGCFFMRGTDHLPLVPDIGNYLFGGSSSDQAITLGGVKPDGEDAVCDMTYIFLKVTEMLSIRDPNINARYHPQINSKSYLKRLCEVNFITAATPSLHNDNAVFKSLQGFCYPISDIRDWSATGCVEPTLSGKHFGHTGSILFNLVAPMEMALNNGKHPLMNWDIGPKTGRVECGDFITFEDFFNAYATQLKFLIGQAVLLNHMLAEAHACIRPTPFLSALTQGTIDCATDVTKGGARYNSSGTANIGLSDVIDSFLVIKKFVFDEKKISFNQLKEAIDSNFKDHPIIYALIQNKVNRFGSGDKEAQEMAHKVIKLIHDCYKEYKNYRGGHYTVGFWSMSQHVAYGNLSSALPSGRLFGKAFTPGLTPSSTASKNFLDNIRDVAGLNPVYLDNNIAFNVKLITSATDSREQTINIMQSYVETYFELGGMQIQFNVITSDVLKDAMVNPENYKNLLVRISGYNAYFVTLNKEMQIELIERAEYGVKT